MKDKDAFEDEGRERARRRQELIDRYRRQVEQRRLDQEYINKAGLRGVWIHGEVAKDPKRDIPLKPELPKTEGTRKMSLVESIVEAAQASASTGTIMERDFKNALIGLKNKIEGIRATATAGVSRVHDVKGVAVDMQAILDDIREYFEIFASTLAANQAPNAGELHAEELAKECADMVITPMMGTDDLTELLEKLSSVANDTVAKIDELISQASTAVAQIETLTGHINTLAE